VLVLGVSAYHGDSAAALLQDGRVIAAAEEERFTRQKHWAGLPSRAIAFCLGRAGVGLSDVDAIALNRQPNAQLLRKAAFVLQKRAPWALLKERLGSRRKLLALDQGLADAFDLDPHALRPKIRRVEHHLAHAASAFFLSPFDDAAILSVDAFGDWTSTLSARGRGRRISAFSRVFFPHSLGALYTAVTQLLGFCNYGDEYKVMGLAPYGEPVYLDEFRRLVTNRGDGTFRLNRRYFVPGTAAGDGRWDEGVPRPGRLFTAELEKLLGPRRRAEEPLERRHQDIAASLQEAYEQLFFSVLGALHARTRLTDLCLVGGCAMNSVANGKIFGRSPFARVYVPPQPGDAGGAIGAAAYVHRALLGGECDRDGPQAFLGPEFDDRHLGRLLDERVGRGEGELRREELPGEDRLCEGVARDLADGKVVGWFQGRMEWGPRALGNRSILADPRRADMREILNVRVKHRERFRPFAPSVLRENAGEYFEIDYPVPFMSMVFQIRPQMRPRVPAVTHVNGSGRLQTVARDDNPLYWKLIRAFADRTGVPVLLNTSFNENEPIVCRPEEALDCFLRTKMDTLVLGRHVLRRVGAPCRAT
jgi:carbamoyltransferase